MDTERSKLPSAANLLLLLGLAALVGSFFVPRITAGRVARIEGRGRNIAKILLALAIEKEPINLADAGVAQSFIADLREVCAERGLSKSNLPTLAEDVENAEPDCIYLISKHYRFLLCREPLPLDSPRRYVFDPTTRSPLEVYAWPRDELGAAASAFYSPEQGLPAYSRNLIARYRGLLRMPSPGSAMPPIGIEAKAGDRRGYRGQGDGERWLALNAQQG